MDDGSVFADGATSSVASAMDLQAGATSSALASLMAGATQKQCPCRSAGRRRDQRNYAWRGRFPEG
eukprot:7853659-Lingulodinium_polyedra.AAC.1